MNRIFVFIFAGALLTGCGNSAPKTETAADQPKQNLIEITNDMENAAAVIPSWINETSVIAMTDPAAHSGEYACATNSTVEYGYAYQELLKNINSSLPKNVVVTGWIYTTVAKPNLSIILNVSEKQQQYDWKSFPLAESLTETGKWVEFSASFYFDKPLNPEQEIRIFPWNQSKQPVYIDDLKISFNF